MSGSLIKEYLIGFGFQIDEAGAEAAVNALNDIVEAAKLVEPMVKSAVAALSSMRDIPPVELSLNLPTADVSGFVSDARRSLSGLSVELDASGFMSSVAGAGAAFSGFAQSVRSGFEGMKRMEISVDTAPLSPAVAQVAGASAAMRSEMGAARASVYAVADAGPAFSGLSGAAASAFRSIASSAQSQMKAAATAVASHVRTMQSALSSLSSAMNKAGSSGPKFGVGGMVDRETRATIGEDGREYVIPVTKPDRAIPLLKAAMKDLNLDGRAALLAVKQLGGSAMANKAPVYVSQGGKRETVNNNVVHHTVSAPATINVYGNDAENVAANVERNQEMLLIRNIKGVYA